MEISKIFIATHKYDIRFTRICVASIRHWYPEIPIYLIKDYLNGDFSTDELEDIWNVRIFETDRKTFGWGFSKLEPLFMQTRERFLILDSDIVFVGNVLEYLNGFDGDFVVQFENQPQTEIKRLYFSLAEMKQWDPSFVFPNYTFNSGQIVATGGLIKREDFDDLVNWNRILPSLKHQDIFTMGGDQGILNYVLLKKASLNQVKISRAPFMKWGKDEMDPLDLSKVMNNSPYPFLLHWAGMKKSRMRQMVRSDILLSFERLYYSRVRLGFIKKIGRTLTSFSFEKCARLLRSVKIIISPFGRILKPAGNTASQTPGIIE